LPLLAAGPFNVAPQEEQGASSACAAHTTTPQHARWRGAINGLRQEPQRQMAGTEADASVR
jgi:hypothetical protein